MKKPEVLYHASARGDIEEFEPRRGKFRDPAEGPVIFAAADKATASLFSFPSDDSWVASGHHNGVPTIVISDEKRFDAANTGGTIYHLPGDTFTCEPETGLGEMEWTSKDSVKPIDKEHYDSALELMLEQGVQVYFVNQDTWKKIQESDDHGFSILLGSESENQRHGVNVKDLRGEQAA